MMLHGGECLRGNARSALILLMLAVAASAAAGEFSCLDHAYSYGTNRVTPHSLYSLKQKVQWDGPDAVQILETDHFDIYMGKDEEEVASRVARIAESWYPLLEKEMGIQYDSLVGEQKRIPLIGYTSATRFQVTNTSPGIVGEGVRGFFDLIRGRIVFPFTGSNELLSHVIRHELVHAFTVRLIEKSWDDYMDNRNLARERKSRWRSLSYEARRMTRLAPRGEFPRFVRGALQCVEDEVALPPREHGKGFLHPQIFFGYADETVRRKPLRVSIRLTNPEEARHFASLPDTTLRRLAALLPAGTRDIRAAIREVSRPYPWIVRATSRTFYEAEADSGREFEFLELFGDAIDRAGKADADSTGWGSSEIACELLRVDHVLSSDLGHLYDDIAPFYRALGAVPFEGEASREHISRSTSLYGEAERNLNRWIPPDAKPRMFPLAVMEGVAEFYSSEWNDLNDLVLRDVVYHEKLVPFQHLSGRHGYLVYVEGKSFFYWLGEKYGRDRVGVFLSSLYRGKSTSDIFEGVFGEDLATLNDMWERSIRRRYLSGLPEVRETAEYAVEVSKGPFDGPPAAEGGTLAYTAYRGGRGHVIVQRGTDRDRIASDGLPGYESLHLGNHTVAINGDAAAYVVLNRGRDEIHLYSIAGDSLLNRIRLDSLLTVESIDFSPDGAQIILSALDEGTGTDLHIVSANGGEAHRLTADHYHEKDVHWGDEGILYVADRDVEGRYDLYLRQKGGESQRLLALDRSIENPRWHPDGILLITRLGDAPRNVYRYERQSGSLRQVTRDAVGIKAFAVDNDTLYLLSNRELRFHLWKTTLESLVDSLVHSVNVAALPAEVPWQLPEPIDYSTAPYRHSYGPDIFFLTGGSFYQQSFLGLSDLLGNRKISIFLGSNADQSDEITKMLSVGSTMHLLGRRNDYRLGLFRFANDFLTNDRGFFFREEYGALAGITHPIDRYRSIGGNLLLKYVGEEPIGGGERYRFAEATVEGVLGYDTTVPGPFGYGFGAGYLASLIYSVDIEFAPDQNVRSGTALADLRAYYPLWGRWIWASRFSGGFSGGDFPREIVIGGSLSLRGYNFLSLEGNRYYLTNQEVRFPFPVRLLLSDWDLFNPLQGAAFVDVGDAWFPSGRATVRGSTGFGLRAGFGGAVLRWDLARKFLKDDFQGGWESDFFLGWNF